MATPLKEWIESELRDAIVEREKFDARARALLETLRMIEEIDEKSSLAPVLPGSEGGDAPVSKVGNRCPHTHFLSPSERGSCPFCVGDSAETLGAVILELNKRAHE